jgi:hypothetical protein
MASAGRHEGDDGFASGFHPRRDVRGLRVPGALPPGTRGRTRGGDRRPEVGRVAHDNVSARADLGEQGDHHHGHAGPLVLKTPPGGSRVPQRPHRVSRARARQLARWSSCPSGPAPSARCLHTGRRAARAPVRRQPASDGRFGSTGQRGSRSAPNPGTRRGLLAQTAPTDRLVLASLAKTRLDRI